eukprot:TRINITY_DN8094_c0_g1_i1.p1 TRINITY_DN8094_c0_g1~~TRINITY_DN8094_c0_g1_i1.p1  ORF type:complete len:206 (+),score=39.07 TRINITY_DN8094_c0_g1_i1:19-636(+)
MKLKSSLVLDFEKEKIKNVVNQKRKNVVNQKRKSTKTPKKDIQKKLKVDFSKFETDPDLKKFIIHAERTRKDIEKRKYTIEESIMRNEKDGIKELFPLMKDKTIKDFFEGNQFLSEMQTFLQDLQRRTDHKMSTKMKHLNYISILFEWYKDRFAKKREIEAIRQANFLVKNLYCYYADELSSIKKEQEEAGKLVEMMFEDELSQN